MSSLNCSFFIVKYYAINFVEFSVGDI